MLSRRVVEAKLAVGAVGDVAIIRFAPGGRVHVALNEPRADAQPLEDGRHPLAVAAGQVVVDGDDVDALAGQAVEVGRQGGTSVLPSPVIISAILPWWRMMPPSICTSKWRMFLKRRPDSGRRQTPRATVPPAWPPWPSAPGNWAVTPRSSFVGQRLHLGFKGVDPGQEGVWWILYGGSTLRKRT